MDLPKKQALAEVGSGRGARWGHLGRKARAWGYGTKRAPDPATAAGGRGKGTRRV